MPQAAWCSQCGIFQWVAPDGTCANGHPAECLSAHHEVGVSGPPPAVVPIAPAEPQPPLDSAFPDADWPPAIPPDASSSAEQPAYERADPASLEGFLVPDATHHMWRRTAAFVIDWLLAMSVGGAVAFTIGVVWALATQEAKMPRLLLDAVGWGVVALLYGYFIIAEGVASTTVGKRLLGLRVLDAATGQPISWKQSFTRNVLLFADLLFLGLVGVVVARANVWRQRIGDSAAGTVVAFTTERSLPVPIQHAAPVGKGSRNLRVSKWAIALLIVIVALFVGLIGIALSTIFAPDDGPRLDPGDSVSAPAADSSQSAPNPPSTAPGALNVATTSNPNLPAPDLDAYIAKQYPGYTVVKRVSFPGQWDGERLGVNYLLKSERRPAFQLMVSVAALKAGETLDNSNTLYDTAIDHVLTNDAVFCVRGTELELTLRRGGQDALVAAITKKLPAGNAFVYGATGVDPSNNSIGFSVERGPNALERAMQDDGSASTLWGEATMPATPGAGPVTVALFKD